MQLKAIQTEQADDNEATKLKNVIESDQGEGVGSGEGMGEGSGAGSGEGSGEGSGAGASAHPRYDTASNTLVSVQVCHVSSSV